ncbi:hypothetical protein [Nonomuraea sp. NPDC001699]
MTYKAHALGVRAVPHVVSSGCGSVAGRTAVFLVPEWAAVATAASFDFIVEQATTATFIRNFQAVRYMAKRGRVPFSVIS